MVEEYVGQVAARPPRPTCVPTYANDRQVVWTSDADPRVWCSDFKARLRWRVTPHPGNGRYYVLHPAGGEVRNVFGDVLLVGGH